MEELIKLLRTCAERDSCIGWREACPYLGTGVCDNKEEKAADAIEELQLYADLYKDLTEKGEKVAREVIDKYPKWIPVGERLPDADGFTLIFTAHGHPGVCYFTSGWWGGYDKDGITHWMPLPEPPRRNEHED